MFKNSYEKIIYIGKAKDIKKRVDSYFSKKSVDDKTKAMLKNVSSLDFIITDNETEAFILENNLIKKFQPKYNIVLKDSKRYAYLKITNEDFPRLITARKTSKEGKYFGPFVSGQTREEIKEFVIKTFKLRTCKRLLKKECLRYHINLCDAPCIKNISKKDYLEKIENSILVLKGKNKEIIKILEKKMQNASKIKEFEKALEIREQILALKWLLEKQNFQRNKKYDEDIVNYEIKNDKVYLILFNSKKGILENKQSFVFDKKYDFLEEFIMQYYDENPIPKEIILPENVSLGLRKFLEKKSGKKVIITVPKVGEKKKLLMITKKNIQIMFFSEEDSLKDLADKLKLPNIPERIECFDISHLSGSSTVASMVSFLHGVADKKNYRRFKIKTVEGIDDVSSINEVVKRRYSRLKSEGRDYPDLIIIDGGKGQLNGAIKALKELRIRIPIISIAKRFEEVYVPGLSIPFKFNKKTKALKLIQRIRDEAHRFAINYNRLLRKKKIRE